MDNTPEAAGAAPAPQTEATPINTIPEQAPAAPDMHGFTSDQLADMKKFFESNGGFDKIKAKISNPEPVQKQEPNLDAAPAMAQQQEALKAPEQPAYRAPAGSITPQEFIAQQYFGALSREEKYASIAKEVESGAVLKDMAALNIKPINPDGSINDTMVRRYLDLKAQTVVAKQTSVVPEASAAPTVEYAPFDDSNMDMKSAMAVLQQDSMLRSRGLAGNPQAAKAEEFMKKVLNNQK